VDIADQTSDSRHLRGRCAEQLAGQYLAAQGLAVLERNFRCRAGELDLVCLDGRVLAVVEVRTRTRRDYGGALASVTVQKQRKIIRATAYFLLRRSRWRTLRVRFDVVAIDGEAATSENLVWIKDAFRS
jgi:putative endonuclease